MDLNKQAVTDEMVVDTVLEQFLRIVVMCRSVDQNDRIILRLKLQGELCAHIHDRKATGRQLTGMYQKSGDWSAFDRTLSLVGSMVYVMRFSHCQSPPVTSGTLSVSTSLT